MKKIIDVIVENHGGLFLFTPLTAPASTWFKENVSEDSQYFGNSLVVENSYARDLADGMLRDSLILE